MKRAQAAHTDCVPLEASRRRATMLWRVRQICHGPVSCEGASAQRKLTVVRDPIERTAWQSLPAPPD
jgi:hypothetical protein